MTEVETYTTGFVGNHRERLAEAVLENKETSAATLDLVMVDIPLQVKFRVLDFCDVLIQNSESPESLKKLIMGLNILEKYGRHLLKPAENRSNMWRHIKYSNAIYSNRVDKLKGGREIMRLMGYTENRPDGVAFPDDGEPDTRTVLNLVIDIILGRKELETYLKGQHPFPKYIEEYIVDDSMYKATDNITEPQADHVKATTAVEQQRGLDFQPETLPALSLMGTMSIPQNSEYIAQAVDTSEHSAQTVGDSDHSSQMLENSHHIPKVIGYFENTTQEMSNHVGVNEQLRNQNFIATQQTPLVSSPKPSLNLGLRLPDETCAEPDTQRTPHHKEVKTPSIVCDICGDNRAEVICRQCDSKQLCQGCHIKWHKHPKRQNHEIELMRPMTSAGANQQPNVNVGFQDNQVESVSQSEAISAPRGTFAQNTVQPPQQHQQRYQLHEVHGQNFPVAHQQDSGATFNQHHIHRFLQHQPYTQIPSFQHYVPGEVMSSKEGVTIMYDPVTNRQFEVPSGLYHRLNIPSMQQAPSNQQHINTTPNQAQGQNRKLEFLPEGQQQLPSGHMSSSSIPNFSQQRYPQSAAGYPLAAPSEQIFTSKPNFVRMSYPEMIQYLTNTGMDSRFDPRENSVTEGRGHVASPPPNLSDGKPIQTSNPLLSATGSRLFARIRNIPNLERRISRLDIDLENLREDLKEWDKQIDDIIVRNPNFFQDEEYVSLNKKKRKHLSDIRILEAYQTELEKEIAEPNLPEHCIRSPLSQVLETETQGSSSSHPTVPTFVQKDHQVSPDTVAPVLKGPESAKYQPAKYTPGVPLAVSVEETPYLKLSSLEGSLSKGGDIPEEVKRMLVLDQSPFDKQEQQMNVSVEPNIQEEQKVEYPPDVRNVQLEVNKDTPMSNNVTAEQGAAGVQIKSGQSAPNLQQVKHETPPVRSKSVPDVPQWECEHCTFINEASTKVCSMCFKTTDKPKVLSSGQQNQEETEKLVPCEHCTFLNKKDNTQCLMCMKMMAHRKAEDGKQKDVELQAAASSKDRPAQKRELDEIIKNDQDQVYLEKKAAQEQFDKINLSGNSFASNGSGELTVIENTCIGVKTDVPANIQTGVKKEPVLSKGTNQPTESTQPDTESAQKMNELQPGQLPQNLGPGAIPKGFRGSGDFIKSFEQIELKRNQEQMGLDGHELMTAIKMAEGLDFEMNEIEIALKHYREDDMKLVDWLKEKWNSMIKMVEETTAVKGRTLTPNTVGDVSREEAKAALIHCDGHVENAIKKCVEDRQNKYKKITDSGQYACEDILTALFQNHGDMDEALDQLNQSVIQGYIDRLWDDENSLLGRQAMLTQAAARQDDLNRSVCNSVVGEEGFQAIIKDLNTDRHRRIRMVFVEGKLVSWGRAEVVIQILEQNVIQSPDPLDCTLEDIIDAVRNCRDRRSSLVYLKQECGTCGGYYPMSKIRNLGVCNCKLCESCLKQCFEIAIREKFVRNWGCPLCDAPGLGNDDTQAADYFDFLHLLLERLVSRDVMELYDTKLRDWHLQTAPNFRWCAHCACGFIWDRPQLLAMECPSCRMKTCFSCKIKWEDQHEGLTCEQFEQWKIDNDPERQAKGVKLYLEENGIDCPSCKMRYSLAKGGCMHFKCPQCGHEFCSGCSQGFMQQGVCKLLNSCKNKGFHCHHPRDCFYYMRDYEVEDLQKLLKKRQVPFNIETPPTQADKQNCPVMEQKEFGTVKKDEACGRPTQQGHAGLCDSHYKEYLVGLINKHKIDPVTIMKLQDLRILIERNEKAVPELRPGENEAQYRNRLMQFIKERFQLQR